MHKEFSQAVAEKIGYYVYLLKDPRNNTIFYIGKGKGNRVFNHINCEIEDATNNDKLTLIKDIGNDNVERYILRHNLTEEQAFEIESACIDLLGLENLSNKVLGHDAWERGLKSIDEMVQHYDAKPITIDEPAIIIKINRLYVRNMSEIDLYYATRHKWKVGLNRKKVKYAIAAYKGLVREVYTIEGWTKCDDGRFEFFDQVAPIDIRMKYNNKSLENYIKKGAQNPFQYVNI
ncbi:hypothetical protein HH214_04640 [Mucilaginibacter robiniae]|uniref:GIY-YIG domain-containing protein n=1 Tax=Mucilaginibacter robiniae TaxID=2728022 RepID=A0A7L5DVT7_9SPHI|nr:hypothetical protein [Mucilaginibacter robiniae]QJD95215.1 hypothetical protein HH214_04640 [Mucilaginibacter robiniae]